MKKLTIQRFTLFANLIQNRIIETIKKEIL
jgi:hypothetical protein